MRGFRADLVCAGVLCGLAVPFARINKVVLSGPPVESRQPALALVREAYGQLPLSFEANQGQGDPRVSFLSRGRGYALFLTGDAAVLALQKSAAAETGNQKSRIGSARNLNPNPSQGRSPESRLPRILRLRLLGASPFIRVSGLDELPGKSSYFFGNDPAKWRTNVPTYAKVRYEGVYPGIDVVYYGNQRQLEYDFVVAPGADPRAITLRFDGLREVQPALGPQVDSSGDLILQVGDGELRFHKPVVYQTESTVDSRQFTAGQALTGISLRSPKPESRSARELLDGRYVLRNNGDAGFEVPAYDRTRPLIIDPVLSYSTYLGGNAFDSAYGIAVDSSGNAYVTGSTQSPDFPILSPLQAASGGDSDVFLTKLNPTGTALVYSTYLGGSGFDRGTAIAVDSAGNAYVTGFTASVNFPTTPGSFQTAYGGSGDAFVAKVKPDGSGLAYSSYLGGSDADFAQGIAVDSAGNAYVTGSTQSTNFPTAGTPFQATHHGASDAFVAKVNPAGSALVYSTYLGGGGADSGQGIALDSSGNAYVAGFTSSTDFPTVNPISSACVGSCGSGTNANVFVSKLNAGGSSLLYSTYLGGSGLDRGFAIAVDSAGSAYVTGDTQSNNFPITPGSFQTAYGGSGDAFVAKVKPDGSGLIYASYLGGSDADFAQGIAVDSAGNAYVTGSTQSTNFPTAASPFPPFQATNHGSSDAFVAKVKPDGSGLLYSSYLGGSGTDFGQAIALDSSGLAYVAGGTASPNFPPTARAFQAVFGGMAPTGDAFVAKIDPNNGVAVALSPQQITFASQGVGSTSPPQTVTLTNVGNMPLTVSSISVTGDFGQTNNCVGTVAAAGGTCTINVTFTPTTAEQKTGAINITDTAPGSPHQISLAGTGATAGAAVTLVPTSLTFGTQVVGSTSASQNITLINSGSDSLSITSITGGGEFPESNTCGSLVAPQRSCTIAVAFAPSGIGTRNGTIAITDNASNSPQSVNLSGTGAAAFSLSSNLTTQTLPFGTTSASYTITALSTTGFTDQITLSCGSPGSCTFSPTSIAPGQSSTVTVNNLTGSLGLTVTGTSGSQTATVTINILEGDFSISASPPLVPIRAGDMANYAITVSPSNGLNQAIALSCSWVSPGQPLGSNCAINPSTVTPDGSNTPITTITATVTTTAHTMGAPGPKAGWRWPLFSRPVTPPAALLWLGLIALSLGAAGYRLGVRRAWLGVSFLILWVALWAACGGGATTQPGTQYGNYALAFTGTLGSGSTAITHSVRVNLSIGNLP